MAALCHLGSSWRHTAPQPAEKGQWRLVEVETVREVVGGGIRISERRQTVNLFNELQDAAKIMRDVRDVTRLCERRHHDQWHAKTVLIRVNDRRRDVVVPPSPVVPRNKDDGIGPIGAVANGIDNRRHPGRS